jgi:hypothetical protein
VSSRWVVKDKAGRELDERVTAALSIDLYRALEDMRGAPYDDVVEAIAAFRKRYKGAVKVRTEGNWIVLDIVEEGVTVRIDSSDELWRAEVILPFEISDPLLLALLRSLADLAIEVATIQKRLDHAVERLFELEEKVKGEED